MIFGGYFDLDSKSKELSNLEKQLSDLYDSGKWDSNENIIITKKIGNIKKQIDEVKNLKELVESYIDIVELDDNDMINEISNSINELKEKIDKLEIETKLSNPNDKKDAILEIHSGAGGTESCDWAEMLFRMYTRWCDKRGFTYEILDILYGEEAGIKSVVMIIKGINAYGYLKCERGVHRLIRLSPFDTANRRHTSFAAVEVLPKVNDSINIEIKESDLRIDVYRSSGAGGQGVNTTDSAVRITHIPTNIVVTCQNERSQLKNKETAMDVLKSKLYQIEEEKRKQELQENKKSQSDINFGSQIRSYVMHPYSMVKDHRTNYETSNVNKVLDGELDELMEAYLKL